jgi:DNA-binding GntR family transcriptional regulator
MTTRVSQDTGASAAESVQMSLRQKIIEGGIRPGTRLIEPAVAESHGVSRNTVREALRLLAADGLIKSVRNAGYSVRTLTSDDIRDIYASRRIIETGAILESAAASDAMLAALEASADAAGKSVRDGNWSRVGTASLEFHQAIVGLAGSSRLDRFFTIIAAQLRLAFAVIPDESAFQVQWVARDRAIADLILSGARDEAARQLDDYLTESETQIIDGIRAAERAPVYAEPHERTA